jgi:hypothetical protein
MVSWRFRREVHGMLLCLLLVACGATPDQADPEIPQPDLAPVASQAMTSASDEGQTPAAAAPAADEELNLPAVADNAPAAESPAGPAAPEVIAEASATVETPPTPQVEQAAAPAEVLPVPEENRQAPAEVAMEPEPPALVAPMPAPAPSPVSQPQVLDLDGLETRLRKTKAIGVFTKLELKSQVGELLDKMEGYHGSRNSLSLVQLEEHFNLLVMKLLVLLEDEDPQLHRDIARARPTLWTTLADPVQFSSIKGP